MKIKQVTVFGGSGFLGQAIVRALAPQGYLVRVACRRIELAEKAGAVVIRLPINLRIGLPIGGRAAPLRSVIRNHRYSPRTRSAR
jgi:NADH dehydrogenase